MKITPWYLAALAPFAAIGCSGAYWVTRPSSC